MARPELHRTLTAAVEAIAPPAGTGLVVTEVELDLPLEIVAGERDRRVVVAGTVPHSRWEAGVLPPVHVAHLHIALADPPPPTLERPHGG
jgi:hypothetical protein